MKTGKKNVYLLFGITIFFIFAAWRSIELVPTHDRKIAPVMLNASMKEKIKEETRSKTADEIIDYSVTLTAKELVFTRKVNCVTYANYCAAVCNYAFTQNAIAGSAKPKVGIVKLWGLDLCKILYSVTGSTFVMNHDFTEVQLPNVTIYVDASMRDLILNDCKKIKKKE